MKSDMRFKVLTFSLFISVIVFSPASVSAITPSMQSQAVIQAQEEKRIRLQEMLLQKQQDLEQRMEQKRNEIQERNELRTSNMEQKREEVRNRLTEVRKERILKNYEIINTRITAAIERLETLIERIEERVAIIATEEGVDVSEINSKISEAKALLLEAQVDLEAVMASKEDSLDTDDPLDSYEVMRSEIEDIKSTLKQVHSILVLIIGDVKGLRVGN